jgi:hypothetical protein
MNPKSKKITRLTPKSSSFGSKFDFMTFINSYHSYRNASTGFNRVERQAI